MPLTLVRPARDHLASYVAALERGWSPNNLRPEVAREHLEQIAHDAEAFLASLEDREATGPPIAAPDGSFVPRLPGIIRWIWDGALAGSVGLRWQRGTSALPSYCLGHIGYAVVPWKRRRGYATAALALILPEARAEGLSYVELTTVPDNLASQKVITANGGVFVERFIKSAHYGGTEELRYRIKLDPAT